MVGRHSSQDYRLGVDIGGTFTDFALLEEATGQLTVLKVSSTTDNPSAAVIAGIEGLLQRHAIAPEALRVFIHGTTLAVNTIIERKGSRAGLLVTKGFRDILNIGRLRIPDIFNFCTELPVPLVPRHHVVEITERTLADGRVLRAPSEAELRTAIHALVNKGVEAVAICFLHSYKNAANEELAGRVIAGAFPNVYLSVSSEVWPQMREYERALATVFNAYIGPKVTAYFERLQTDFKELGLSSTILSTRSNGGVMSARRAGLSPIETLLSGPASGVIGAAYLGRLAGIDHLITLDMGGTSADVGVVQGEPRVTTESHVGDFPVILPAVDVASIGAGGGSIAWTDADGVLKVGPRSAGANPGPACYRLGGIHATVTDAYVALGILNPRNFLGGQIQLDAELANAALDRIGQPLGLGPEEAAEAILNVATAQMYAALVPLMARKRVDLVDYTLLAYGGAGPTHAFILAREVGIRRVLVPPHPGVVCALGCLISDVKSDFIRTVHRLVPQGDVPSLIAELREGYKQLEREALTWLDEQGIPVTDTLVIREADIRYLGQSFEILVPISESSLAPADSGALLRAAFHSAYSQAYGHTDPHADIEVINIRVTVVGQTPKPALASSAGLREPGSRLAPPSWRFVHWSGQRGKVAVYQRGALLPGTTISSPAIIEQYDSTTFIPEGYVAKVDHLGSVIGEWVNDNE